MHDGLLASANSAVICALSLSSGGHLVLATGPNWYTCTVYHFGSRTPLTPASPRSRASSDGTITVILPQTNRNGGFPSKSVCAFVRVCAAASLSACVSGEGVYFGVCSRD